MARVEVLMRALMTVACATIAISSLPVVFKALPALALVLYLPGRCLLAGVLTDDRATGEIRSLSVALSMAITILVGLGLGLMHQMTPVGWASGLSAVSLAACVAAACRSSSNPAFYPIWERRWPSVPRVLALLLACGLSVAAVSFARHGALNQKIFAFTDVWMVPADGPRPSYAVLGVKNEEGRTASYAIDLIARDILIERIAGFDLTPGKAMSFRIAIPSVVFAKRPDGYTVGPIGQEGDQGLSTASAKPTLGSTRLEARLYKDGDRSVAYRTVWLALPPPLQEESFSASKNAPGSSEAKSLE